MSPPNRSHLTVKISGLPSTPHHPYGFLPRVHRESCTREAAYRSSEAVNGLRLEIGMMIRFQSAQGTKQATAKCQSERDGSEGEREGEGERQKARWGRQRD